MCAACGQTFQDKKKVLVGFLFTEMCAACGQTSQYKRHWLGFSSQRDDCKMTNFFPRSSDLTTIFVYSLLESSAFNFKFVSLYQRDAVEVIKRHNVCSDNAGEEIETKGVTKDFDRFTYMLKENESFAKLLTLLIKFQHRMRQMFLNSSECCRPGHRSLTGAC